MKKHVLMALLVGCAVLAAGCGSKNTGTKEITEAGVSTEAETKTESSDETESEATEAASEVETNSEGETEGITESISEETSEVTEEELAERPEYKALDYVTLGTYKGLSIVQEPITVTDEEVEQEILSNVDAAGLNHRTEGKVKDGDTANIDFVGKLDEEAFDGGTAEGYDLEIGSHSFIEGFEEGLVGVAIGDTVDLDLTFPEDYGNEELAGQETVFTVTVNYIKETPEITDDLIAQLSDGAYTTVDGYHDYIREQLVSEKEQEQENAVDTELFTQLYNTCTINDYPQELVDYSVNSTTEYYKTMAEQYGMEFADFLEAYFEMDEEQFAEEVKEYVKQDLQTELILRAIAEQEEITVSEEEYLAGCEKYLKQGGYDSVEQLEAAYGRKTIENQLLMDKAFELVRENAVIEEAEIETESETETETITETGTEAVAETENVEEAETASEVVKEAVSEAESETE